MRDHNMTVLVVEDEVLIRLDLTEAIEMSGYFVRHARSAEEALEMLETDETIGVVFLDIVLPRMDGIELAHIVREKWPNTMIIYSSGNIDVAKPSGPEGAFFLHKPYSLSALKHVLSHVPARSGA